MNNSVASATLSGSGFLPKRQSLAKQTAMITSVLPGGMKSGWSFAFMPLLKGLILFMLFTVCLFFSFHARDVVTGHYNVTAAHEEYDAATADYDATTARVKMQRERVSREQASLKQLQRKQLAARKRQVKAKENLYLQRKALDKDWVR